MTRFALVLTLFTAGCIGATPSPGPRLAVPPSAAVPAEPPATTAPPSAPPAEPAKPVETPPRAEADDDDLREAVFRHLFTTNASGMGQRAKVYCLQVAERKDPSDPLLARFAGNNPPVKKASRCKADSRGVVDLDTGERGLVFRIDSIERTGPDAAIVHGGYYEAGLSASGNVYELARQGGRWVVKKDTMQWISQRDTSPSRRDRG